MAKTIPNPGQTVRLGQTHMDNIHKCLTWVVDNIHHAHFSTTWEIFCIFGPPFSPFFCFCSSICRYSTINRICSQIVHGVCPGSGTNCTPGNSGPLQIASPFSLLLPKNKNAHYTLQLHIVAQAFTAPSRSHLGQINLGYVRCVIASALHQPKFIPLVHFQI